MASLEELRSVRLEKIEKLQAAGMEAYPPDITSKETLSQAKNNFSEGRMTSLVGRVMAIRGAGAINFIVIDDGTAEFQIVLKKDEIDENTLNLFKETVDVGDFVWFSGELFITKRGAESLLAAEWKMAGKSLLPLPDKHAGLQDKDEIYRKRYLDTLTNRQSREVFKMRSKVISAIRNFFDTRDFMEIETPILQNQAGGAMAETFNTHHNDYDIDMVLRIALELEHKMIVAGGYPRIYEIGKNFRNEGSDPTHIQEFTMMEWYAAYQTLEQNMQWTEELIKHLAKEVVGKTVFTTWDKEGNEVEINIDSEWQRLRFPDLLKEHADLDITTASLDEIKEKAQEFGMDDHERDTTGKANLLDFIYKKSSRNAILGPAFVTDYPGDLKPLAQQNEDGTARVAQLIIAGAEITNQYAELVDPIKQRKLLESQADAKARGDKEAMEIDDRFLTAMEHGMPPMTGFGMGIDRLVAFLTEQKNLRDVIFFPIVRPKE
ncbi:lysine--tRNA ligase [Candidatus Campbellbacteria bacterium]|nr:lysine--tRNA ligase [Candidatus Campbellbacteria bacterium]